MSDEQQQMDDDLQSESIKSEEMEDETMTQKKEDTSSQQQQSNTRRSTRGGGTQTKSYVDMDNNNSNLKRSTRGRFAKNSEPLKNGNSSGNLQVQNSEQKRKKDEDYDNDDEESNNNNNIKDNKDNNAGKQEGGRRNQFWKYRHKGEKAGERKIVEPAAKVEPPVHKLHFNHINMENQEQVMRVSILKGQEFNERLINKKLYLKTVFKQQQRETNERQIPLTNSRFPQDMPIYLFDQKGKAYYSNPHLIKEKKGTIEQFVNINVQHENNLQYLNDLGATKGSYISNNVLKQQQKRKRRKKHEMQQLNSSNQV